MTIDITKLTSSSGGGSFIGQAMAIDTLEPLYIAPDETHWLRSGLLETGLANYPDAETVVNGDFGALDDSNHLTLGGAFSDASANHMAFDKVTKKIYLSHSNGTCEEYTQDGVFIRELPNTLISGDNSAFITFTVNDGIIYVIYSYSIYIYNVDGVYQEKVGTNKINQQPTVRSLEYVEGYLYWVSLIGSDHYLLRAKADGTSNRESLGVTSNEITGFAIVKNALIRQFKIGNFSYLYAHPFSPKNDSFSFSTRIANSGARASLSLFSGIIFNGNELLERRLSGGQSWPTTPLGYAVGMIEEVSVDDTKLSYYKRIK